MNEALSPAEIVFGRDNPPRRNSELVEVADQIVTSDVVAVKVPARVLLVPTPTLPKFKEVTLEASWPAAVPVPDKAIDTFDALETSVIPPIALPSALGIKKTTKVTLLLLIEAQGQTQPTQLEANAGYEGLRDRQGRITGVRQRFVRCLVATRLNIAEINTRPTGRQRSLVRIALRSRR